MPTNVQGVPESALLTFGGFVSEINDPSVPPGSAVIATDCDFSVASAKTRDGIQNVYSYEGNFVEAPASAGISVSTEAGEVAWANPSNITHNTPGTYATVTLNAGNVVPGSSPILDEELTGTANAAAISLGPLTPTFANDFAIFAAAGIIAVGLPTAGAGLSGWTQEADLNLNTCGRIWHDLLSGTSAITPDVTYTGSGLTCAALVTLTAPTGTPTIINTYKSPGNANILSGLNTVTLNPTTAGNALVFIGLSSQAGVMSFSPVSDGVDTFVKVCDVNNSNAVIQIYVAADIAGGTTSLTFNNNAGSGFATPRYCIYEISNLSPYPSGQISTLLEASAFPLSIPASSSITGVEVTINGKQSNLAADAILTVAPLTVNNAPASSLTCQLPISDGSTTIGTPTDEWQQFWTNAQVDDPVFGFSVQAQAASSNVTYSISGVEIVVWYTPPGLTQFDHIASFENTDGLTLTLALDNQGTFWQEDVFGNPNVLTPFFTAIEPDTFAVSITLDDREYIALSDLQGGTDMPRQYNGQWVDRVSQVGPAIGPQITATSNSYAVTSITQAAAETLGDGTSDFTVTWTANYGSIGPAGNILSFEAKPGNFADILAAGVGSTIIISGVQTLNGQDPNNTMSNPTYTVIACGTVNTAFWGPNTPYFSVLALSTNHIDVIVQNGATYQLTLATLTAAETIPNLQVGSQMTVAGSDQAGYNKTWTVTATPNASQMSITQTSLSGGIATYDFTLITGTVPVPGQQVTVTNTANGNGIFNVVNQVITAATASSFSIAIVSPDIPAAAESGNGIVNGTIFQFDPMAAIGNGTGGTVVIAGGLGGGTRGAVVLFKTRNNAITPAGPQTIFTLSGDSSALTVSGIPIGPPNVVARIIAFTGANGATQTGGGGFYYWIEQPSTAIVNGQTVNYDATIVNDNTTTQATFNFTDAQLLAATGISIDGNNLFATIELGSCLGFVSYSQRLFAWGENNKIQNLLNPTFDGGVGQTTGVTITTYPLGWTIDPTNGAGGSIISSPQFGDAYYIKNASGSTQAFYGMITQSAYQDSFRVPIINSATAYSVRVTASIPSGNTTGNLVVDLFSPSTSTIWGSFTIPFASLSTRMQILTGTLLPQSAVFGIVPSDLLIRIYATGIANGADVELDRIEPFPTLQPVLTTQLRASYVDNFEAFDGVTGNLGAAQNQQPVRNAFELFDNLYIVKTKSMFWTVDNGTTEPNFWSVKTVSNKCGTPSIHGVDLGEGWAIIVGEAGVYVFIGGEPVKISPELDGTGPASGGSPTPGFWQSINWKYGYTLWVRNDSEKRKLFIGIPIATPNKWMPNFPKNANPTQPNVLLVMDYKELMTAGELQGEGPVRLSYTGELKTYSFGRKWSAWSIQACYGDFIDRNDSTTPLFLCGDFGTGKIYQQIPGVFNDDGQPERWQYVTYGFPKSSEAQQVGMGLHDLIADYMSLTIVGSGDLQMIAYPNSLDSPDATALYPETLANPSPCGDIEIPLNVAGNRFFIGFSLNDANDWAELSKVVMAMSMDPWAPVRGSNN